MTITKHVLTWFTVACLLLGNSVLASTIQDDSQEEAAIAAAVQRAEPSIVQIETIGGLERVGQTAVNNGPTTGVVIDSRGFILSSTINFLQQPSAIFVRLSSGKRVTAEQIATDVSRKLVLLKVSEDSDLLPIQLAPQNELRVGQTTIALGRTYNIKYPNPSIGILSAKGRIWDRAVQTDAKISPANFGGPLIDLYGRMIGILVPLSPDSTETASGQEWYDSGIGFAVPIERVMNRMDELIAGNDLLPGKMGIAFRGTNIYDDPAIVQFRPEASPAAAAGIMVGDTIVELNGRPITRQAQFRHAIGPLYAGEVANIVVMRDEKRVPIAVELAASIEPFKPPGIGVLIAGSALKTDKRLNSDSESSREKDKLGIVIEHVIPGTPAAKAGLRHGDRLIRFGGQIIQQRMDLQNALLNAKIGSEAEIQLNRNGAKQNIQLQVGTQSATPLSPMPERIGDRECDDASITEIKVPEFANQAILIAPKFEQTFSPETALLVWVTPPGTVDKQAWIKAWKEHVIATRSAVLLLAPADKSKWVPGEREFIKRATDIAAQQSNIRRSQVCIGGQKAGGSMAALTAFHYRPQFKGLVLIDANLPASVRNPETSPTNSLLIFLAQTQPKGDEKQSRIESFESTVNQLSKAHFPVHTEKEFPGSTRGFNLALLQWIQSVDRL